MLIITLHVFFTINESLVQCFVGILYLLYFLIHRANCNKHIFAVIIRNTDTR